MKLNLLWGWVLASLAVIPVAQANLKCPSVAAIRAAQFNMAKNGNNWIATQLNQTYDTAEHWNFAVGPVDAENKKAAEAKLLDQMKGLKDSKGPTSGDMPVCFYANSDAKLKAIAFTPPTRNPVMIWNSLNIFFASSF